MRKIVAIAVFVVLPACANARGLEIQNLQSVHDAAQYIEFQVHSTHQTKCLLSVAVEAKQGGEWREIAYSISKSDPVKGQILVDVEPGQTVKITWDSVELPMAPGEYRFRIEVLAPTSLETLSVEFTPAIRVVSEPGESS